MSAGGQGSRGANLALSPERSPLPRSPERPPQLGPEVGGDTAAEKGEARGRGSERRPGGPPAPGSEIPPPASGAGVLRPPPNTCGRGEPRARLAPPLPLPRRLKQRSPGARPGAGGAAHRARVGRAPGAGARRPGPPSPGSARLPGVTGVPVDGVAEAGAPSQRGAEERGPEDSPQQGQQPHRPRGPLWSGPAGPGPLRCRGEKGTKWRWGGGGVRNWGWGAETRRPRPR